MLILIRIIHVQISESTLLSLERGLSGYSYTANFFHGFFDPPNSTRLAGRLCPVWAVSTLVLVIITPLFFFSTYAPNRPSLEGYLCMLEALKYIWFSSGDLEFLAKQLCSSLAKETFELACPDRIFYPFHPFPDTLHG